MADDQKAACQHENHHQRHQKKHGSGHGIDGIFRRQSRDTPTHPHVLTIGVNKPVEGVEEPSIINVILDLHILKIWENPGKLRLEPHKECTVLVINADDLFINFFF